MYIYMYMYICIYMCTYIHVYLCIYVYTYICIHMYHICLRYTSTGVYVYTYIFIHIYMLMPHKFRLPLLIFFLCVPQKYKDRLAELILTHAPHLFSIFFYFHFCIYFKVQIFFINTIMHICFAIMHIFNLSRRA